MSNDQPGTWKAATVEAVNEIVQKSLIDCDPDHRTAFLRYSVVPHVTPIVRYGQIETVVVVAQRANEVLYWEDVEEGFNISPLTGEGSIAEHCCNQDSLAVALSRWAE